MASRALTLKRSPWIWKVVSGSVWRFRYQVGGWGVPPLEAIPWVVAGPAVDQRRLSGLAGLAAGRGEDPDGAPTFPVVALLAIGRLVALDMLLPNSTS